MDGGLKFTTDEDKKLTITRMKTVENTKAGEVRVNHIHTGSLPSIPMCLKKLSHNESKNGKGWRSVEIDFTNREDMLNFSIEYGEEYLRYVQEGVMYGGEARGFVGPGMPY